MARNDRNFYFRQLRRSPAAELENAFWGWFAHDPGRSLSSADRDRRWAKDQELPYAKKPIAHSGFAQDVVSVITEDLRSNPNVENQEIIETHPATLDGQPGIKLAYRYRAKSGLTIQGIHYGAMVGDWYYYLIYEAPVRYYFPRDPATVEMLKENFKIGKEK